MKKITSLLVALLCIAGAQAITMTESITVAEALAIGEPLAHNTTTDETYSIVGYVNAITENSYNTNYNNMTFWIADTRGTASSTAQGALQCYRARPSRELQVGDKVRVEAKLKKWYEKIETDPVNAPVVWLESQGDEPEPEIPTGTLRVCAQNLENYYYNYTYSTRPDYDDAEGFRTKTLKIVNVMLDIDADIYAFCEVEAKPIVLQQLADSMNAHAGAAGRYAAVSDNIDYTLGSGSDNHIKSGFIYRTDKVATVGNSFGGTPGNGYYAHTMRIQTFKQLSNNEKLVVSMNHFKAKDNSSDAGEGTRITNADNLISMLMNTNTDPDKLILGDLNCLIGEAPLNAIVNAGYEEQLLRYDPYAYSHCFGGGELIDHVFANASMAEQIVNAYVKHVSTYKCTSYVTQSMSYSDHDPYVVEINLGLSAGLTDQHQQDNRCRKVLDNGQLILILPDGSKYSVIGVKIQ